MKVYIDTVTGVYGDAGDLRLIDTQGLDFEFPGEAGDWPDSALTSIGVEYGRRLEQPEPEDVLVSFCPQAVVDHFEGTKYETQVGALSVKELEELGALAGPWFEGSDALWELFHKCLVDALHKILQKKEAESEPAPGV